MRLNDLKPTEGSKSTAKRVGRGPGSGLGKTAGRGQKGQKSRRGTGKPAVGFEGGQMPLQRRLPKFGFTSRKAAYNDEITVERLAGLDSEIIDIDALKAAKLVARRAKRVKVIAGGEPGKALQLKGLPVTRGARAAIEAAGGSIED